MTRFIDIEFKRVPLLVIIYVLNTIALLSSDKQWTIRAFIVANERREVSFIDSL